MKGDRERCLAAGMDEFLSKPLRRQELFAALERVLAGTGQESGVRSQDSGIRSPQHAASRLDAATLLTACDGDAGLLAQMIAVFRASSPGQLERVAAAVRTRDASALREAAHRLCGLVSAFSNTAAEAARTLEQAGVDRNLDGTDAVCASLADMLGELTVQLDELSVAELRSRLPSGPNPLTPWPKSRPRLA
jgi:CheY-like chemotaxis protein